MLRENQIKNLKEQNEVLNQNIHLNQDKKELFELNFNNDIDNKNMNKLLSNTIYKSIAKNRRGYLFKDLSTNTKKIFEGYNKENPEILDLNKINNNNINSKNNIENGIRIANYQGMNNLNNNNIINNINSKEFSKINNIIDNNGNTNDNFNGKKLNINFNIFTNDNRK